MKQQIYPAAKRLLDITAATAGLTLTLPVILGAAAAIRREDGGPAFFSQQRVGQMGRPFTIIKLRTMRHRPGGPALTAGNDGRVTAAGAYLRRRKIDELPQLINVLRGEMSLVGPRPEVPRYVDFYTARQMEALKARPGITDPASLLFWDESERLLRAGGDPEAFYLKELLPRKIELSVFYQRHATFQSDILVIGCTLWRALKA